MKTAVYLGTITLVAGVILTLGLTHTISDIETNGLAGIWIGHVLTAGAGALKGTTS